jgi:hypothetical protein
MEKRRLVLLREQHLLGETLDHILTGLEDVDVIARLDITKSQPPDFSAEMPDLVIIADEASAEEHTNHLSNYLIKNYPQLPVIRVNFERNILQIYLSQKLPEHVADLADLIRRIPLPVQGV